MDIIIGLAVLLVVLLVQVIRTIGAFRLKFLTASLSEMAKATSQEDERLKLEAKMRSLVRHLKSDSFVVETYKRHSRLYLRLFIAGSGAVMFGVLLVGLVLVYNMIVDSGSLAIDSMVSMYIGFGRFYLDMVDNYLVMVWGILYFSVVLWPVMYVYDRMCVARQILKGIQDVAEPAPIDRYGLSFSGVAPLLSLLLLALVGQFFNYGIDLARYEGEVSANLESRNLRGYVMDKLSEESFSDDDHQEKLFVGVLLGRLLEETDAGRRQNLGVVICEVFGQDDDNVNYFLNLGFRERLNSEDLQCDRDRSYWQRITEIPGDAQELTLGTAEAANVEESGVRWFYFVAPFSGNYALKTESPLGSDFDSVMAMYSMTDSDGLNFIEFNDDDDGVFSFSLDSNIVASLDGGVRYYVGVSEYYGKSGSVDVSVSFEP